MKSVTVKGFFVMHCLSIIWILVFVFFAVTPNIEAQATPAATNDYELQLLLKVPMRDGIRLNATIYRPVHATSPLPVIFSLSPYPMLARDGGGDLASHGYIYAFVQSRGRGDSEGSFDPMAQESHDGYDVVEWFAKQPWCNGKVGMAGGSYAGGDQWITAATRPPHLTTIIPAASAHPGIDFPWLGNIADNYALQWLAFVAAGKSPNEQVYEDEALWSSAITRFFLKKAAFNTLDSFEGNPSAIFQKWLTHPDKDDYWIEMGAQLESVAAIDIPVLEITGQQDGDQAGALDYHDQFVSKLSASGAPKQDYLIIGPWEHSGTRVPRQDVDGEHYGSASLLNMERLHREWYDYTMKGNPRPAFLRKPVAYYVVGKNAECWKYADSLEAVSTSSLKLYLDPTGGASSVYHSGMLLPSQNGAAGGQWTSDPNDLSASSKPEVIVGESSTGPAGESLHGN
ncbi:MAG TPA: CocE/NonD family hydrolase, partial [Edaphobacter sp.]|nr:CocE/NonD family hydrolase [Edaphobacter sp.]